MREAGMGEEASYDHGTSTFIAYPAVALTLVSSPDL